MRICIHRGAEEIGGNCVELEQDGARILLDLGLPLDAENAVGAPLPQIPGLAEGDDPSLLAIILSHPHADHYGLIPAAHSSIPVWLGKDAEALLKAALSFSPAGASFPNSHNYQHRKPFKIGPFTITPFLIDHSAFDSYGFLVEAGNRRIFYSGDLRAHGRKGWTFSDLVARPPANIDALLLEGTTLSRASRDAPKTETMLEQEIVDDIAGAKGAVLAWFSGQNIDRFVTFFRAAIRTGRTMVIDPYLANLLLAVARDTLPDPRDSELRVFLPKAMKSRIIREKRFDLVEPFRSRRIYPEELGKRPEQLLIAFRPSMRQDIEAIDALRGAMLIYSLWPGYLSRRDDDFRAWCADHGIDFVIRHCSGHADSTTLRRLADALAPRRIVPIHTEAADRFPGTFASHVIDAHRNGEWWDMPPRDAGEEPNQLDGRGSDI